MNNYLLQISSLITPPWDDDSTEELIGRRAFEQENRTPRIPENVMTPLLAWSIRFIETFSDDIIGAFSEYSTLLNRTSGRRRGQPRRPARSVVPDVTHWLEELRLRGDKLPGKRRDDGVILSIDWEHISRILDVNLNPRRSSEVIRLITSSNLRLEDGAALTCPIRGKLDGAPWLDQQIRYLEAEGHARRLSTACFVVTIYLSGQRVGETLSLRRGCTEQDEITKLWLLRGTTWKDARDDSGTKIPQGIEREQPWVVTEVVAKAVDVLERLHGAQLLFPSTLDSGRTPRRGRIGTARTSMEIRRDLNSLVSWVNEYCRLNGRSDSIPEDVSGRALSGSRFRRTLAWHINRRPRGLVAGAIQYGHLRTQMFVGYAGSYASGFPDDISFEEFLLRLEEIATDAEALDAGEHVSGPAAERYRRRVVAGNERFAGRVLQTSQAVQAVRSNPDLQVFSGQAMTCVFDARTALCESDTQTDSRRTPTLDDCRLGCTNLARTDRDVSQLREEVAELREIVADPSAPSVRHRRERIQLEAMESAIKEHENGRNHQGDKS